MPEMKHRNRLFLLRKRKMLSQDDVCKVVSIDKKTLYNYERGYRPIPSDKLIEFAKLYERSTDFILCFDCGNTYTDEEDTNEETSAER